MQELFIKGGIIMYPLMGLSILALAIFLHRAYVLYVFFPKVHKNGLLAKKLCKSSQQAIEHIWLIASVAPLFGLLGTVLGIIKSFQALGVGRPDVQVISFGLAEALITTATGLFIAIPCQIIVHFLQQKLDTLEQKHNKAAKHNNNPKFIQDSVQD